ncbi:MAG TPA: tRNA (adenosine(37)-N6)-threonylcarbamoyltransferase complex transferase subunit TsaD [Candidatus Saccharimonadales bacterium]|nr:tRNA (adenosine(37)-N6)-threonylcarbamoyltransferase complex transferase subunit TsaD [Candidatus Saccharimonadales bacterium]
MRILGIETSCDETAAAIVDDGRVLVSNVIESQIDIHKVYGGVVPEVAARSHIEVVLPVIDQALSLANCGWDDIDAVAVTYAPGLIGSLLIGTLTARTLAILKHKPLYPVHHVEGHVYANFLLDKAPEFPMLALIVSGGHSQLVLFRSHGDYDLLGQTQDDAVGEAFDKVAKIIGLPYPGGPSIAIAAERGDARAYQFPKARMQGAYDFSFSGLKTAVLRRVQAECGVDYNFPSMQLAARLDEATRNNFAASFQRVAVETLVDKTIQAYRDFSPASVVIAGGVAANQELRRQLRNRLPIAIDYAPIDLCTDNAAMIATLAYYQAQRQDPCDPYSLEVVPSLSM